MKKLLYILPEYSNEVASHFYHSWELISEIAKHMKVSVFIEEADTRPARNDFDYIYIQRFQLLPLRLMERFLVFFYFRLQGYNRFYVHISHITSLAAAIVARLTGGEAYYWNCGLRSVSEKQMSTLKGRLEQRLLNELAFRLNLNLIHHLVTGTKSMANHYCNKYKISLNKIIVLPNSINLERFNHNPISRTQQNANKKKVVLFLHSLTERKGVQFLPEIIKRVSRKYPDVLFLIAGEGYQRRWLEQRIKEDNLEDYVLVFGGVPNKDVPGYFAVADIFIMPSMDEGFPRVLLEAMAMGVPFVATNVGGVKDILAPVQSVFVLAHKCGNAERFSKDVLLLLNEPEIRDTLSQVGIEKVKDYELSKVAQEYVEVLNATIG